MATPRFLDIFSLYFDSALNDALKDALLEKCSLDIDSRSLNIEIKSTAYINRENSFKINNSLKSALKLENCEISYTFCGEAFCEDAAKDLTEQLKLKNAVLNGYFNGAEYALFDDTVAITLKHGGYNTIAESGFEKQFKALVKTQFGIEINVEFCGQLDDVEMELPPIEYANAPAPKAAPKKEEVKKITFEKREDRPQNGIVYLDNPQLFYGRRINSNTKSMIEVTPEDSEICCWGQVFGVEVRKINTKRGEANIISFSFSDFTNSLSVSIFADPKKWIPLPRLRTVTSCL